MMKFQSWTVFLVAIILSTANAFQKSSLILSAKWGTFDSLEDVVRNGLPPSVSPALCQGTAFLCHCVDCSLVEHWLSRACLVSHIP